MQPMEKLLTIEESRTIYPKIKVILIFLKYVRCIRMKASANIIILSFYSMLSINIINIKYRNKFK